MIVKNAKNETYRAGFAAGQRDYRVGYEQPNLQRLQNIKPEHKTDYSAGYFDGFYNPYSEIKHDFYGEDEQS